MSNFPEEEMSKAYDLLEKEAYSIEEDAFTEGQIKVLQKLLEHIRISILLRAPYSDG